MEENYLSIGKIKHLTIKDAIDDLVMKKSRPHSCDENFVQICVLINQFLNTITKGVGNKQF